MSLSFYLGFAESYNQKQLLTLTANNKYCSDLTIDFKNYINSRLSGYALLMYASHIAHIDDSCTVEFAENLPDLMQSSISIFNGFDKAVIGINDIEKICKPMYKLNSGWKDYLFQNTFYDCIDFEDMDSEKILRFISYLCTGKFIQSYGKSYSLELVVDSRLILEVVILFELNKKKDKKLTEDDLDYYLSRVSLNPLVSFLL